MARILVTGGAGYVGSSVCAHLLGLGHSVHILDDLSTGRRELALAPLTVARIGDSVAVRHLLAAEHFDCVMHFAARSLVAESVEKPDLYRENNVEQLKVFLAELETAGVRRLVFSSSCAVFGDPGDRAIAEDLPKGPVSPYGETKLEAERLLAIWGGDAVALRYFNAAGAEEGLRVGECHEPETHLIPRVLQALQAGQGVQVNGTDYPTPDGTCVRDYVHVTDLARAHTAAMERLLDERLQGFHAFNLGTEKGHSVREVVRMCEAVTGMRARIEELPRRAGDPPRLVADARRARAELGFELEHGLRSVVQSAWNWERKRGVGFKRAVFLDRDGTINVDPGYLGDPAQFELLPGAGAALRAFKDAGFALVVVTNQSGIGRGIFDWPALRRVHERMQELLEAFAVQIDRFEICPHAPDDGCSCRKPSAELLVRGARALGVALKGCVMVGDKPVDVLAGRAAGCGHVALVRTGEGELTAADPKIRAQADCVGADLAEVAKWVVQ